MTFLPSPGRHREFLEEWDRYNGKRGGLSVRTGGLEAAGVDRRGFFQTMRAMYDESLAHQDYQIGRLVERLRERGEWEHTLVIVAADHAIAAALYDVNALAQATLPPRWDGPMLASSVTRIPLIVVWPRHIAGGRRIEAPVSMIHVLPTVLDLVGAAGTRSDARAVARTAPARATRLDTAASDLR